jgi:hypothetical protein
VNPSYEAIRQVLKEFGPMTSSEVQAVLHGARLADVSSILSRMRRLARKQVYIKEWVYESDAGGRHYPRAVYALGNRRCAPKPSPKTECQRSRDRRVRERVRKEVTKVIIHRVPNSVFALSQVIK